MWSNIKDISIVGMFLSLLLLWYMDHSRVNDLKAVQVETTTLMGKFVEGFGEVESILRTLIESFNRMQEQLDNQPKVDTSTLHAGVR